MILSHTLYKCINVKISPFVAHSGLKRSGKLDIVKISGPPVRDFFPDNKRNVTTELDVGPSR